MTRPVVLIVLDGWGVAPPSEGNAITRAQLPFYNFLMDKYPHGLLQASGESVGLPRGEDGNTETGHLNLGAGYIVYQDLQRINMSIADGSFFQNRAFLSAIDHARKYDSNLHLVGLVGAGGVHSNIEHLLALLQLIKEQDYKKVYLHMITDGRDSPPKSSLTYLAQIKNYLDNMKFGAIATLMGRYYAMDRDLRWDRTEKAYRALTQTDGPRCNSIEKTINDSYKKGLTDEFIIPAVVCDDEDIPYPRIANYDSVIFFNYRIDRPRQLTKAFIVENFEKNANNPDYDPYIVKYKKKHEIAHRTYQKPFKREIYLKHLFFVTMTEYSQTVHASQVAYPPHIVVSPLAEVLSNNNMTQLHMAESEKERFVTYYFNGQREVPFLNEDTVIVPSPKVATYDLQPEMSAYELTDELILRINTNKYDFILINFANPDMVGHTGNIAPSIKACEVIDECLSKIIPSILQAGGIALVTADHGNVEELINLKTGGIDTEHSNNYVPFIAISKELEGNKEKIPIGILADIAPTVLFCLDIEKPKSMTGRNLLENIL